MVNDVDHGHDIELPIRPWAAGAAVFESNDVAAGVVLPHLDRRCDGGGGDIESQPGFNLFFHRQQAEKQAAPTADIHDPCALRHGIEQFAEGAYLA